MKNIKCREIELKIEGKNTNDKFVFFRFALLKDVGYEQITIIANNNKYQIDLSNKGIYQIEIEKTKNIKICGKSIDYLIDFDTSNTSINKEAINEFKEKILKEHNNVVKHYETIDEYLNHLNNKNDVKSFELTNFLRLAIDNIINNKLNVKTIINNLNNFFKNYYHANMDYPQNWWDYEIGIPKAIIRIIALLYDDLSNNEIFKYLNYIYRYTSFANIMHYNWDVRNQIDATGANLSDTLEITTWRAIYLNYLENINANYEIFKTLFVYTNKSDGFYKDGSFIQHYYHSYNGSYGEVILRNMVELLFLYEQFNININDSLNFLYDVIIKHYLSIIHKGYILDTTRGRSISRRKINSKYITNNILNSILKVSKLYDVTRAKELIKKVSINQGTLNLTKSSNESQNFELNAFNVMNQYNIKSEDYMIGLSLSSKNILTHEMMNKENLKGWYYSLGYTPIYLKGEDIYNESYFPTINPYYLSGVTNSNLKLEKSLEGVFHQNELTYGILSNNLIWIYFDLNSPFENLVANKSYLLYEGGLLQLISNVVSKNEAHTTLYNFPSDIKNNDFSVIASSSYLTKTEINQGNYLDINELEEDYSYKRKYEIGYINHQTNENFWYIINNKNNKVLPTVIENSDFLHIVEYNEKILVNSFKTQEFNILNIKIIGAGSYLISSDEIKFKALNKVIFSNIKILESSYQYEIINNEYIFEKQDFETTLKIEVLK